MTPPLFCQPCSAELASRGTLHPLPGRCALCGCAVVPSPSDVGDALAALLAAAPMSDRLTSRLPDDYSGAEMFANVRGFIAIAIKRLSGGSAAIPSLDAHPLAPVLREVLGLGHYHSPEGGMSPVEYLETIAEIAQAQDGEHRKNLIEVAAVALAGIEACDAAAGVRGEGPGR